MSTSKHGEAGLLEALAEDVRARLFAGAARKAWTKGAAIFNYGDDGSSLLLIDTGRAELSLVARDGHRTVLGYRGPGDLVGEMAMLDGGPRSADVRAATPVTGRVVSYGDFRRFLLAHPEVALALLTTLTAKLREANAVLEDRTRHDAAGRLTRCLRRVAAKFGAPMPAISPTAIALPADISQSDLAELAGVARETVNRLIRRWSAAGLLVRAGKRLVLRDPDALTAAVDR